MAETSFLDLDVFFSSIVRYYEFFFPRIFEGDPTAIALFGIVAIIVVAVLSKITPILYAIIKRVFLLLIIVFSFYLFMLNYGDKFLAEGTQTSILILGGIGLLFGVIALFSVLLSFHSHARKVWSRDVPVSKSDDVTLKIEESSPQNVSEKIASKAIGGSQIDLLSYKNFFKSVRDERSVLSVLSYIVIAEFGVFSSITISAPSPEVGISFLVAFLIAALIFIKTSYHSYRLGLTHLFIALIFGFGLSIILGNFWANISFDVLLSIQYFQTNSLVAFITGMAVSLFMGSRN